MSLKKLGVLALVIGALAPFVLGGQHTSAITPNNIPTDIRQNFKDYDNGTYIYNGNPYPGGCSDIAEKYLTIGWVSKDGDPGMDDITVPYGTASVPLEWEFVDMLCKDITNVDASRTYPGLPNDGDPAPAGLSLSTIHQAVLGSTVTVNIGSITLGNLTTQLRADQSTTSRYWFSSRNSFGYNLPANLAPGTYTINIRFKTRTLNTFGTNTYACVDNTNTTPPGTDPGNYYTKCPTADAGASFTLRVAPPAINFSLTPSVTVDQPIADIGSTVHFTYNIDNSGPTKGDTSCRVFSDIYNLPHTPYGANTVSGSTMANSVTPDPPACSNLAVGTTKVATESVVITAAMLNHAVCRSLRVNPSGQVGVAVSGGETSPEVCVDIVSRPYFQVSGGDVAAGAGFMNGATACTQDNTADITSWNNDSKNPSGAAAGWYYGAGSQMAAFALRNIKSFVTGLNPAANTTPFAGRTGAGVITQGTPVEPYGLSFANSGANTTGDYGGGFGQLPCLSDYASMIGGATAGGWTNDYTKSATYNVNGNVTISGGTLGRDAKGNGVVINILVRGNAIITGDVKYDDGGGPDHYPRLNLVATGNIYVASGVKELHGLFVAQGTTGAGTFVTCASGTTELTSYDSCSGNRLTVYGAVAAQTLHLDRSLGTVNSASGPAESFRYGPEFWLATPDCLAIPTDTLCTGGVQKWDAITGLPPVL